MARRPESIRRRDWIRELGEPAASAGHLAHLVDDLVALDGVEVCGDGREFGEEWVRHDELGFALAVAASVAQEQADADLEGLGETVERGERGNSLAVFNFGDVGAWHLHASRELTLAETAAGANLLDSGCDIDAGNVFLRGRWSDDQLWRGSLWLFLFEGFVATPAE